MQCNCSSVIFLIYRLLCGQSREWNASLIKPHASHRTTPEFSPDEHFAALQQRQGPLHEQTQSTHSGTMQRDLIYAQLKGAGEIQMNHFGHQRRSLSGSVNMPSLTAPYAIAGYVLAALTLIGACCRGCAEIYQRERKKRAEQAARDLKRRTAGDKPNGSSPTSPSAAATAAVNPGQTRTARVQAAGGVGAGPPAGASVPDTMLGVAPPAAPYTYTSSSQVQYAPGTDAQPADYCVVSPLMATGYDYGSTTAHHGSEQTK